VSLTLYIALTALVILSGLIVLYLNAGEYKKTRLLLAFSGAYLFGISFLHFLPEVYETLGHSAGIYILIGFFIQITLEFFSKGIEHGHIHDHHGNEQKIPIAVFAGLFIHSFLEGMPIDAHSHVVDGHSHANNLIFGIVLHKIPVAIVLVSLLLGRGFSKRAIIGWLVAFSLMMPLGSLLNHLLHAQMEVLVSNYSFVVLGIVLGVLLHISTTILFETSEHHRFNLYKFLTILLGIALAFFSI